MKKRISKLISFVYKNIALSVLFVIFITSRFLKAPAFWVAQNPFKYWLKSSEYDNSSKIDKGLVGLFAQLMIVWYFAGIIYATLILICDVMILVGAVIYIKRKINRT